MERVLTSKPRRAGRPMDEQIGDGGDSPAWSRKRGSTSRRSRTGGDMKPRCAAAGLVGPVRRAARPFGLQLPRRSQHAGRTRGGGRQARSARHRADRPRRALRGGAVRRGGQGTRRATVFGAELSLGGGDRTEEPDPPGPHLLVLARGPEGYRRLSSQLAQAHLAGGEKGILRYDFDALTEAAGGHWQILTGCRKGHVRQALSAGGPDAAEAALADLVDRFGRDRVSVELTHHGHPLDDERNAALAGLAPRFGLGCRRHHRRAFRRALQGPAGDGDGSDPGQELDG